MVQKAQACLRKGCADVQKEDVFFLTCVSVMVMGTAMVCRRRDEETRVTEPLPSLALRSCAPVAVRKGPYRRIWAVG